MNNNTHTIFGIEYTTFIKGVAVFLLVVHHYVGISQCSIVNLSDTNTREIIYNLCKVCVGIFAILSGYGMYKTAVKSSNIARLAVKRICFLLIGYWMAFIIWLIYGLLREGSLLAIYKNDVMVSFFKDIFGLCHFGKPSNSLNLSSWFIGTIIIFYISFPILYWLMNSLKKLDWIIVIFSAVPTILFAFNIKIYNFDSIVYYIFAFTLGMLVAKRSILDYIADYKVTWIRFILIGIFFVICCLLRLVWGLAFDTLFALTSIVFFTIVFKKIDIVDKIFLFLGKREMFIYLFHIMVPSVLGLFIINIDGWIFRIISFLLTILVAMAFTKLYLIVKRKLAKGIFYKW